MQIGPHPLTSRLILAPMAGVTDLPYRKLCRRFGASMAVAEMSSSNPALRHHRQTLLRSEHQGEPEPRSAQIVGTEPLHMADAARFNVERGAQIIDINMGCPAKKVCNKAAGSALLRDERRVAAILEAVVGAVDVPVTLKIRTGWDPCHRNAIRVAVIAEQAGISAISVHGRTRACGFSAPAEYLTIRDVKRAVGIPVIANGDIDTPAKAKAVLDFTAADAVMIGRAALGRPWLFREIDAYLTDSIHPSALTEQDVYRVMEEHLLELYAFYGDFLGVRIARKHVGWYLGHRSMSAATSQFREFQAQTDARQQLICLAELF